MEPEKMTSLSKSEFEFELAQFIVYSITLIATVICICSYTEEITTLSHTWFGYEKLAEGFKFMSIMTAFVIPLQLLLGALFGCLCSNDAEKRKEVELIREMRKDPIIFALLVPGISGILTPVLIYPIIAVALLAVTIKGVCIILSAIQKPEL